MTLDQKEQYVQDSLRLQLDTEKEFLEFFGEDAEDVAYIYIEQFRDHAQKPVTKIEDVAAVPCSRKITYESALAVLPTIIEQDVGALIKKARRLSTSGKKHRDKKNKDSEFMQYMRGYSKYWNTQLNENDCDEEIGDLEWLILAMGY